MIKAKNLNQIKQKKKPFDILYPILLLSYFTAYTKQNKAIHSEEGIDPGWTEML